MTKYRLSAHSIISIESDILEIIDIKELINKFANSKCRQKTILFFNYYFYQKKILFLLNKKKQDCVHIVYI